MCIIVKEEYKFQISIYLPINHYLATGL